MWLVAARAGIERTWTVLTAGQLRGLAVLFALAMIGAGCSQDSGSEPEAISPTSMPGSPVIEQLDPAEPSSPYELDSDEVAELAGARRDPTPLQQFFDAYAPEEKSPAQYEEELAECMAFHGFKHIPFVSELNIDLAAYNDVYVVNATLGYGISTLLGREPIAVGESSAVDPNEEIYHSLTDEERAQYEVIMGDCQEEVGLLPTDEQEAQMQLIYTEVISLRRDIDKQIDADWRVIEAQAQWRTCMANAGYHYQSRQQIHAELTTETDSIMQEVPTLLGGGTLIDELPGELGERLTALQTKERAVAQADLSCRRDLDDILYDVRVEVEQAAIDQDPGRVERVALALGEAMPGSRE